jgi:hypothetical protein
MSLYDEFMKFSLTHSWYKHIDLSGAIAWTYQDCSGSWRFTLEKPSIPTAYSFRIGPFLRGTERSKRVTWGLWIILERAGPERFLRWIHDKYPEWAHISADQWLAMEMDDPILLQLYEIEQNLYYMDLALQPTILSKNMGLPK